MITFKLGFNHYAQKEVSSFMDVPRLCGQCDECGGDADREGRTFNEYEDPPDCERKVFVKTMTEVCAQGASICRSHCYKGRAICSLCALTGQCNLLYPYGK